jgi:uncharacterized protein YbgA (DUF1722 family)/uncharacterized protein YbbK (DUF523 family)
VKSRQWPKPIIGISSCLLGNRVRHNGEHKRNTWIVEELGPHVTWIALCPEVQMKLGVPRETLRLVGSAEHPSLLTVKTKIDHTENAHQTFKEMLSSNYDFDSYIFKKDSPTCGLERVKVYGRGGIPSKNAVGLFAEQVKAMYPITPMIEEGRLSDARQTENFLIQLFAWTHFRRLPKKISALQLYHQAHKLQFMVYDPKGYQALGKIAAHSDRKAPTLVFEEYQILLHELLKKPLSKKKYINAFQHMLGYFKEHLAPKEKQHILTVLDEYRDEKIPMSAVATLFKYLIDQHSIEYLQNQSILEPYPSQIHIRGEA